MATDMTAHLVIDSRDTIGEGPAWDAANGRFLWMDNACGTIHEAKPAEGGWQETRHWTLNRRTAGALPRAKGGLVVVVGTEILAMDEAGTLTPFARIDADAEIIGFNEAKCDPQGRLWAGTFAHDFSPGLGALYRIDPDGRVSTMLDGVNLSNGLDWSPDETTFYFIDSGSRTVDAFDFDAASGTISRRRTIVTIPAGGGPDGMAVDDEGMLWVAVFGTGEVQRYTPEGELIGRIRISPPAVTSCAFGGPDLGDLFITSAAIELPEAVVTLVGLSPEVAREAPRAPGAGGLFVCRPGVGGRSATAFAG